MSGLEATHGMPDNVNQSQKREDGPDFGELQIGFDPFYAIINPGHGYQNRSRFWPLDPSGHGKMSNRGPGSGEK